MRPVTVLTCAALLAALLLLWSYILKSVPIKPSMVRSVLMNLSVSAAAVLYVFLALELLFYSSFVISDTFSFTLASQRWMETYWHPINALGYRDVEHDPAEFSNKQVLLVVGDSFVAGHGIARIEDRFSNVLQRNLGEHYLVVNVARNGWNTADEYQAIVSYPYKPKKIVLSYYINDILGAAERSGYVRPIRVEPSPNRIVRYLTDR